jgi:hypothetical protein
LLIIGTIIVAWKGVLPIFFHRTPANHDAVKYFRDKVVEKDGKPVVKGSGPHVVPLPGVTSYRDTDTRFQTTRTEGFSVDIGSPKTTYYIDRFTINWKVVDATLYQTIGADPEVFIADLVTAACRQVLESEGSASLSTAVITQRCSRRIPTLTDVGVKLISVLIVSGSYSTRNHRILDGDGESGERTPIVMADEL